MDRPTLITGLFSYNPILFCTPSDVMITRLKGRAFPRCIYCSRCPRPGFVETSGSGNVVLIIQSNMLTRRLRKRRDDDLDCLRILIRLPWNAFRSGAVGLNGSRPV